MVKRNLKELEKFEINENIHFDSYENANEAFEQTYLKLNAFGEECAPRGKKVREFLNYSFEIRNPMDNLVYSKFRGLSPKYLAREYSWYNNNPTLDVNDASKVGKAWLDLADNGEINSNYGYYLFKTKEPNQELNLWDSTVKILKDDPDSRKALIQLPIIQSGSRFEKDTICTSSLHFFIRNNKLNLIVYMRSNDEIFGTPIDIFQFTMWQIRMANELNIELGSYYHNVGSMHLYEPHWIENNVNFDISDDKFNVSNKYSEEFLNDLELLNQGDSDINDETLKEMLKNVKIWKF